jgi:tetratricopeptide (TPR) repeat protein
MNLNSNRRLKMKALKHRSIFLWMIFFVLPISLFAHLKEIPVTTKSKEALKYFLEGRDKNEDEELVAAAALLDKAIKLDPAFAKAYLYRSLSGGGDDVFHQNLDKAVSLADKVSEGEKLEILLFKAWADGNNQKQKEIIDQLLKSFPSDKRVHMLAGYYFSDNKELYSALIHFKKSAELDNKYAPAYNMIGYCESTLDKYTEAGKAFQAYIKLRPDKPAPYNSYAELLLKMGKYDESVAQYRKAIEIDPAYINALAGIGNNYLFKGDYESARKYYRDYFDKAPDIGGKLYALTLEANSFVFEGKIKEAIGALDERFALAEKENKIPESIYSVADQRFLLTETGNLVEGMKYCEKAIALIEKANLSESDKENLIKLSMGWHIYNLIALGELDKASAELEKYKNKYLSLKQPLDEKEVNFYMAYSELKRGNYEKAIQYYSKTDTVQVPFNWYCTGVAYSKKGDKQNASKYFEKIVKLNVNALDIAIFRKRAMEGLKK